MILKKIAERHDLLQSAKSILLAWVTLTHAATEEAFRWVVSCVISTTTHIVLFWGAIAVLMQVSATARKWLGPAGHQIECLQHGISVATRRPSGFPPLQNAPLEPGQNVPGTFYMIIILL